MVDWQFNCVKTIILCSDEITKNWCVNYTTGAVETVLWGVVGRDPAREWVVEAFKDCIVPI